MFIYYIINTIWYPIMSCIFFLELHIGYCVWDGTKLAEGHKAFPPTTSILEQLVVFFVMIGCVIVVFLCGLVVLL